MSADRLDRILDAAYACFTRYGFRRTTMDDIAATADMSRPAVYQHVRNKEDAFRRLASRLVDQALATARTAANQPGGTAERLDGVLAAKLDLTVRLYRDSAHAAELLAAAPLAEPADRFTAAIADLVVAVLAGTPVADPAEFAQLALALTRGLEADLTDPDLPRTRLRTGVALLLAGATRQPTAPQTPQGVQP